MNETAVTHGSSATTVSHSEPKPSNLVYVGACACLFAAVGVGCCLGYNSPALPSMIYNETLFNSSIRNAAVQIVSSGDTNTLSWIGSIMGIGALIGSLASGPISQTIGRKVGLELSSIGSCLVWILLAKSHNVAMIILFRMLTGVFAGLTCGIAPTYSAEIATKNIRGRLGTYFQLGITIGILFTSMMGFFFDWRQIAIFCALFPLVNLIIMYYLPETPYFLLQKDPQHPELALTQSLEKFRTPGTNLQAELQEHLASLNKNASFIPEWEAIKKRDFYMPLSYALILMFFQQFSGINMIISYQEYTLNNLFKKFTDEKNAKFYSSIGSTTSCFFQVVTTMASGFLIERVGRNHLLITSAIGHAVTLGIFGYYYFQQLENFVLPILCLSGFLISFSIGWGPVPWLMIPELAKNDYRSLIACVGSTFNWFNAFLITKFYLFVHERLAPYLIYWMFAGICLLSCVYVIACLPETRGKNFQTIQREIRGDGKDSEETVTGKPFKD